MINFAYKHPRWTHNLVAPIKGEGPRCDNYREIPLTAVSRTRNCHNCRTRNCQLPRSVKRNGTKWRGSTRRRATVGHKSARNLPRTADCTVQHCTALYCSALYTSLCSSKCRCGHWRYFFNHIFSLAFGKYPSAKVFVPQETIKNYFRP